MPEFDLALNLGAEIKARISDVADELKRMREDQAARDAREPVWGLRIFGQATVTAAGTAIVDMGGPAVGRRWELRSIVIGGPLWSDALAGAATIGVGQVPTAEPATADVRDQLATLPGVEFYSAAEFPIRQEHLWVGIATGTAAQVVSVAAIVTDFPN